jgi:pSer/pThr/pTyr-binding forkhead associated (FHA) protein
MQQPPDAFLIVEKGEPYQPGEALPLVGEKVWLGRPSEGWVPHIPFDSPFISRRHATIECKDGVHFLTDNPENRHGTSLNGKRLAPGEPRELKDRDRISLARDAVVLIFATATPIGSETWDYPGSQLILEPERREVTLDGQPLPLTGKLYALLALLYENQGRAVSARDIKKAVWKERVTGADGMPLVTDDELRTLVYRLRKRLGPYGSLICTIEGYGYMLDLQ